LETVRVWLPSVTWLLVTPLSVVMVAPDEVAEMSKVPAATATLTWLELAILPVPLSANVPALIVVTPVNVLVPESVSVPEPCLVRLKAPAAPFCMTPENVVDVPSPTVRVRLAPPPLVAVPAPDSEPIVSLKLLRASVAPDATV
jgi:hypothetical protein